MVTSHHWDLTPQAAIALQRELAPRVCLQPLERPIGRIAGVDVGFEAHGATTRAAVVVYSWPGLEVVERALHREATRFPYVPGLLSFRELPAVLGALQQLNEPPDLLLCDGQGIAHPRRLGIAAHLGVLTTIPAIGVGKSRLTGSHAAVSTERGSTAALYDSDERIGTVLRTRAGVRPLYVSPGYGVSQQDTIAWCLACAPRYRLPEPLRAADRLASNRAPRRTDAALSRQGRQSS